jgi:nitroimidazol reductase NimA-like FMN-containing flavoprotein (pyridoxamine 5'-phosphate oxidase superfamily)
MIRKMKELILEKDTCVLATVSGDKPHCSLMSYLPDPEARELYMVTLRHTKKYQNLLANPWVSLLIDTREDTARSELRQKKALTVNGVFQKVEAGKIEVLRSKFIEKHPQLQELVQNPSAEIISIRLHSFQLLEGFQEAYFAQVE